MNEVQKNDLQEVRVINKSNLLGKEIDVYGDAINPLFLAKDVAEWIEHSDVSTMIRSVDDDEKDQFTNPNNVCGGQKSWFLTESGLYEVLMLSRKPIAKEFKKGVKKILHKLRTTGTVQLAMPKDYPSALRALADQVEVTQRLEAKSAEQQKRIDKQQPYVDFALEAFQSESKVDIGQAAKILHLPFGRNTLFKRLREDGGFFKDRNEPLQKFIDAEYFIVTQLKPIYTESGREIINVKVFCTQKGLAYLNLKYGAGVREVPAPIKQAAIS